MGRGGSDPVPGGLPRGHDAVKPRPDAVGVGLVALSPGTLERRLDGVLRLIDVARHEAREADEA